MHCAVSDTLWLKDAYKYINQILCGSTLYEKRHMHLVLQCTVYHSVPGLKRAGHRLHSDMFFDTLKINCSVAAKDIFERATQREINLRVYTEGVVRADQVLPQTESTMASNIFVPGRNVLLPKLQHRRATAQIHERSSLNHRMLADCLMGTFLITKIIKEVLSINTSPKK